MKRSLTLALLAILIISCRTGKSGNAAFTVEVSIKDTSFEMLYLEEVPIEFNRPILIDSAKVDKNGKYILHGPAAEDRVYYVRPSNQPYPLFVVLNDAKNIQVDFKLKEVEGKRMPSYTVNGSPASKQVCDYTDQLNNGMFALINTLVDLDTTTQKNGPGSRIDSLQQRLEVQTKALRAMTDSTLKKAITPSAYIHMMGFYQSIASNPDFKLSSASLEEIAKGLETLASKFPKHNGLTAFRKQIEQEIKKSKGLVGQLAPEFSLPDVNGQTISLKSFRGKWVLVDFWASWCGPCRMENPNVVAAYGQFRNKNFTILGVSLDRPGGKADWMKAIKDDKLEWTHVSDLKYWDSMVVPMYNIQGIPYNVLINPDGKVVAENLRGEELAKKLSEFLK